MKLGQFFSSSIGKKTIVALTGLFMIFFLVSHLLGNLQIFLGPDALNSYGYFLRTYPVTLWVLRILLLLSVFIHIYTTILLTRANTKARLVNYKITKSRQASQSSKTMMLSGLTVGLFILYHLAHYTFGWTNPEFLKLVDDQGRHHIYNMMILGFKNYLVSGFYIGAQILLAMHISHGFSSCARTLGVANKKIFTQIKIFGILFATLLALLYSSIPLSILMGYLNLDN